jgi:Protein of unknown function (DUF2510)/Domain of unknown function (DUF4352)
MTTPPTPAGWYPDPDGSGGQRYWDGFAWTEHRSPAAQPTPGPREPAHAAPPGTEEQTAVVPTRPGPSEERVGAHRKPEPEPTPEPEPPAEPEPQPTAPVAQRIPPTFAPPPPMQPGPPATAVPPVAHSAAHGNRNLIVCYSLACAALLAVLVLVVIYGLFSNDSDTAQVATPTTTPAELTAQESPTAEAGAPGSGDLNPTTETQTPAAGATVDGPLSFTLTGVETGDTVSSTEAPVEKTAQGDYIVVRMSVVNTSDVPAQFLGTLQKLHAGGATYNIDDEATFYVGGGFVEIPPGREALVGVAYDVPPGTVAESIELHVDPLSPGVQLPL